MSSLTNKWKKYYTPKLEAFDKNQDITPLLDKLGKLEDLEEQLGCPLEVVVKALEYGIYAKDLPREELSKQFVRLSNVETEWYLINNIMCVNLKDYKISFWLKEDKSE